MRNIRLTQVFRRGTPPRNFGLNQQRVAPSDLFGYRRKPDQKILRATRPLLEMAGGDSSRQPSWCIAVLGEDS
jgi:hypothetical protein